MSTKERLLSDIKDAMRAQDKNLLSTLRLVSAAIKQVEVDERLEVDDERLIVILNKMIKQRKESIVQFEKASRDDLVAKEQAELEVLLTYLPKQLSDAEINHFINEAFKATQASRMSDMGKVISLLKSKLQGKADMAKVSALVKAKLN